MEMKGRIGTLLGIALLIVACGGGSGSSESDDGEGTPFEGIGEAADNISLLQDGPLTVTTDPGHVSIEVDGQLIEFNETDSEVLDCIVNDGQFSVILRNDDGSEVRLSGLRLPDGWNPQLSVSAPGPESLLSGAALRDGTLGLGDNALSYEGPADVIEGGAAVSQKDVTLAANCNT